MHLTDAMLVQTIKRFIQNQQGWILHQCLCNAKALPHAKGILADRLLHLRIQSYCPDGLCHCLFVNFFAKGGQQFKISHACKIRQKSRCLNNNSRIRRKIHIFADSLIIHGNFTGIRNQKSADTFHQHGLAAAVVAHNAVNPAFLKIITDMMQHGLLAKTFAHIHDPDHITHYFPSVPLNENAYRRIAHMVNMSNTASKARPIATVCPNVGSLS